MKNYNKRLVWLDVAKGIAICLMVIGHSSIPSFLSNFIWAFHMPLFFIASGWTTDWERDSFGRFLKKKTKKMLIPFCIYSTIVLLVEIGIGINTFWQFVLRGWVSYALWFVPVLFFALVLSKSIFLINNEKLEIAFMGGQMLLGYSLAYWHVMLPWTLSTVPFAVFLVMMGRFLKHFQKWIDTQGVFVLFLLLVLTFAISQKWRLDMCFNRILPVVPIILGAIFGTMMLFMLSRLMEQKCRMVSRLFTEIGKETYVILAFSQIVIMLLNSYFQFNAILKYLFLIVILFAIARVKKYLQEIIQI